MLNNNIYTVVSTPNKALAYIEYSRSTLPPGDAYTEDMPARTDPFSISAELYSVSPTTFPPSEYTSPNAKRIQKVVVMFKLMPEAQHSLKKIR